MVLFKDSLAQWVPVRKDGSENVTGTFLVDVTAAHNLVPVIQALPKEFVDRAVTVLVTNFIPLKPSDLEGRMADPEEWVNSEEKENEQWVFQIRVSFSRSLQCPLIHATHSAMCRKSASYFCKPVHAVCCPTPH